MRWIMALAAAFSLAAVSVPVASAEEPPETPAAEQAAVKKLKALLESLHPAFGDVSVAGANAVLHLGKDYYFLSDEEAKRVLVEGWGNPPEAVEGVLGMVFPAGKTFLDDSWGAVVTYEATGHVSDEDAQSADYDALLDQMRSGEEERNAERTKAGYSAQHLVGWAQPPSYDARTHAVIWARDIRFADQTVDTLNYDVRLLGRSGVLSLNMVSTMAHLADVRQAAEHFGRTAEFHSGFRYADFNPDLDEEAGYGIAGLVAAGAGVAAAKKLGLLATIAVFGKKFIFIIIAGLAAGFAWIRRKFGAGESEG